MDLIVKFMLFLHLTGLAFGAVANVVMPLVGAEMASAEGPALGGLRRIAGKVQVYSKAALAVILLSGVALVFLRYDGNATALGPWFTLKMVLVAALVVYVALTVVAPGRLNPRIGGMVARVLLLSIIATAIFAFR
jgi:protoporphyrinogen IX oxidase